MSDSIDLKLPNTKRVEKDARKLVDKLIEGRNTEKEKFDAIFLWVAQNMSYSYSDYLAPKGYSMHSISSILRNKTGVCLDYAHLMDTLCFLAGITNVSIYGYAKDDLYDVNDSLFMDNHAWNAVRLDNLWYLYDATWASGSYTQEYNKWSKIRLKWKSKLYKKVKIKNVTYKLINKYKCKNLDKKITYHYLKRKYIPQLIIKFLDMFPYHGKLVYDTKVNFQYYLTDPKFFSVLHIPDLPFWALKEMPTTIRELELDSAFYHQDSLAMINKRGEGVFCDDCNKFLAINEKEKYKKTKHESFRFNRRNRFVTSLCNYNLAHLNYIDAIAAKDSATKITLIDSTLMYLKLDKQDLAQCIANLNTDIKLQRIKNSRKRLQQEKENKAHMSKIQNVIVITNKSRKGLEYFDVQFRNKYKSYFSLIKNLNGKRNYMHESNANEKQKKILIEKALNKYNKASLVLDSVLPLIDVKRLKFDEALSTLTTQAWLKIGQQDSVVFSFFNSAYYRFFLIDSYKKLIVEERKRLKNLEKRYIDDITANVFNWSDTCQTVGKMLFKLIELRNKKILEMAQSSKQLTELKYIDKPEFYSRIENWKSQIEKNRCEYVSMLLNLKAGTEALKIHKLVLKEITYAIRFENKMEALRFQQINKKINWRKKKYMSIPKNNLTNLKLVQSNVIKYKKEYLKSLKIKRSNKVK